MTGARRVYQVPQLSRLCVPGTATCRHVGQDRKPLCAKWRAVGARTCRICSRPIGFEVLIVDDAQPDLFDRAARAVVHLVCDELERGKRRHRPRPDPRRAPGFVAEARRIRSRFGRP